MGAWRFRWKPSSSVRVASRGIPPALWSATKLAARPCATRSASDSFQRFDLEVASSVFSIRWGAHRGPPQLCSPPGRRAGRRARPRLRSFGRFGTMRSQRSRRLPRLRVAPSRHRAAWRAQVGTTCTEPGAGAGRTGSGGGERGASDTGADHSTTRPQPRASWAGNGAGVSGKRQATPRPAGTAQRRPRASATGRGGREGVKVRAAQRRCEMTLQESHVFRM